MEFSGSSEANISLDSHVPVELLPVFVGWSHTDFAGIVQELHSKLRKFFESTPALWLEGSCSACFSSTIKHFRSGSSRDSVMAREEQELGKDKENPGVL